MCVLDLGCGLALSSVFLAREYGVKVWAIDNFFPPTENFNLIKEFGLVDRVFPLSCDARSLPFPEAFFDCVVIVNSYYYFGTDDKYLPYLAKFLKENGEIGISDICFKKEIETIEHVPSYLRGDFAHYWQHIHSLRWWINKWEKTELVDVICGSLVDAEQNQLIKEDYIKFSMSNKVDAFARGLKMDKEDIISYFTLVAKRSAKDAFLESHFLHD